MPELEIFYAPRSEIKNIKYNNSEVRNAVAAQQFPYPLRASGEKKDVVIQEGSSL